jgi:predicted outer membrane repeat protein
LHSQKGGHDEIPFPFPYIPQKEDTMKSLSRFLTVLLTVALFSSLLPAGHARAAGTIRYVAPGGMTSGSCTSWANACTLKYALSIAVNGDQIWVKKGVYYPGTNRTDTFTLKNGVAIYGGFAGTETALNQRDWQTNLTILSGDIDQNDINTDGNFIAETWSDIQGNNAYHVVTGGGTNSSAVLDGFIITAGLANSTSFPDDSGGGMYNSGSSPTLTNVTFSGNNAYNYGGGMYNSGSSPTLTNVTFSGNSAEDSGGGMYNDSSSPTLSNVTFSGNSAIGGGGMSNGNSNPTLTNVTFSGNSAIAGGGMSNGNSNPTLTNVTFSGNSAGIDGGGMFNDDSSSPTLTNVTFSGNSAYTAAGCPTAIATRR